MSAEGSGTFEHDPVMRAELRADFPPELVLTLPATAKRPALSYVSQAAVTDRLNQAAPGWTYDVEPVVVDGKDGLPHVVAVLGTMTVGGVARSEVGAVDSPSSYGQELKEAISDFVRRGAMRFGVAIALWAPELVGATGDPTPDNPPSGGTGPAEGEGTRAKAPSPETSAPAGPTGRDAHVPPAADPTLVPLIAGPSDWRKAANELHTSQTQAQARVLAFLKSAGTGKRNPSDVTVDDLGWALASITTAKRSETPNP